MRKAVATSAVHHFRVQELGAEYETGRITVIARENRINLQGYDIWQWCRSKRIMGSGWWPRQPAAWEYAQCCDYVDCWLFASGSSSAETSSVFIEGMPGTWWPVVVGLPYPIPQSGVFPYACPALCNNSNKCWLVHVSRLVLRNGVRHQPAAVQSRASPPPAIVAPSEAPTECGTSPPPSSVAPSSSWAAPSSYAPSSASSSSWAVPSTPSSYAMPSSVAPSSSSSAASTSFVVPSSAASSSNSTGVPRRWGRFHPDRN